MKDLIAALLALLLVAGTLPSPAEPEVPVTSEVESTVSTEDDYDPDDFIAYEPADGEVYSVIEKSLELELKEVKPFLNFEHPDLFWMSFSDVIGDECSTKRITPERILTFELSDSDFIGDVPVNPTMTPDIGWVSYYKDDKFLYITSTEYDLSFLKKNSKLQFITYDGTFRYWEADIPNNYDSYMKAANNAQVMLYITAKIPVSAITKENMFLFNVCNELTFGGDYKVNLGYVISDKKLLYRYFLAPEDILMFSYGLGFCYNDFSPMIGLEFLTDEEYELINNSEILDKYISDVDKLNDRQFNMGVDLTDDNYYAILKRWASENKEYINAKIKAKQEELDSRNDASYLDYDVFVPTLADIEVLISNSNKYITELNNYLDSIESE